MYKVYINIYIYKNWNSLIIIPMWFPLPMPGIPWEGVGTLKTTQAHHSVWNDFGS